MSKIVITTGGTGGHIFPALAVAEELKQLADQPQLLFIGSQYGPEEKLVRSKDIQFYGLDVRGFLGRGLAALSAGLKMFKAILVAIRLLRDFKPDCVVGFGSYAAFAPVLAANILGIPTVLHEQNAIAGTTNKVLGRLAKRVCVTLPATQGFQSSKCVLCGNPIRHEFVANQDSKANSTFQSKHLLILGGSQGCHALNIFMQQHLDVFKAHNIEIFHQTGVHDFTTVQASYIAAGYDGDHVKAFVDDMLSLYLWADLVLCRSGASTVAELCVMGLPAIYVPFPHAIHNHQEFNARQVAKVKAAHVILENNLKDPKILAQILDLLNNSKKLQEMHRQAKTLAMPDAAARVVQVIDAVMRKS